MTGVICDICGNIVLSGTLKVVPVKFGERTERVRVCERCWRRDREAPEKYIRKHFAVSRGEKVHRNRTVKISGETILTPPTPRGGLNQLARDLKAIRKLLFQPKVPLKGVRVEEQREKAIDKLVNAIDVAELLAKNAKETSEKGMADTTKARYYHLLGYLVQVLDSVLRSVTLDEIQQHVKETDKEIVELRRAVAKAEARARAVKTEARGASGPGAVA